MALFIFSHLVGKPILDRHHEKVAVLKDVVVRINPQLGGSEEKYPPLAGLLAHVSGRVFWIPASHLDHVEENAIQLISASVNLERFVRRDGEILLGRDVLDKQLVDVEGRRIVRVNDLALGQVPGGQEVRLLAVDISFRALSRRILAFGGARPQPRERLLDWADVQYFASHAPTVQLQVSHDRLAQLHPADLARLLDELSYQQRDEVVRALDDDVVADALEELSSDEAADILEEIEEGRASDILEEMHPDAAADVVADLDSEKAEALLSQMGQDDSDDVRELLAYSKASAGGIMTNEFLQLPAHLEAAEALRTIRAQDEQPEFVDYIYITDPDTDHLIGVTSLRDVVFFPDRTVPLDRLMKNDIVSVHPLTPARHAAALVTEYGLRALPVVDEYGNVLGIITFDDALDVLLPAEQRRRFGHLFTYRRGRQMRREPRMALQGQASTEKEGERHD